MLGLGNCGNCTARAGHRQVGPKQLGRWGGWGGAGTMGVVGRHKGWGRFLGGLGSRRRAGVPLCVWKGQWVQIRHKRNKVVQTNKPTRTNQNNVNVSITKTCSPVQNQVLSVHKYKWLHNYIQAKHKVRGR